MKTVLRRTFALVMRYYANGLDVFEVSLFKMAAAAKSGSNLVIFTYFELKFVVSVAEGLPQHQL